jgi:opacity protein-like surface antigen
MTIVLAFIAVIFFENHALASGTPEQVYEDYLYVHCLKEAFKTVERDVVDHTRAFDPGTGRNFVYDKDKEEWIDTKTGEVICPKNGPSKKAAAYEDYLYVHCLKEAFKTVERDIVDHARAFDPGTGRNFHYDKDKEAWIDSKTGEQVCPPPTGTTPPPPTAPKTNDVVKTASVPARFELGLGYSYMHADAEVVQNLNGFNVSGFYNVNTWFAVGGEFSGLYGTMTQNYTGGSVKTSLDRYLYLFGPQVTVHPCQRTTVFGRVMVGGVYDENKISSMGDTWRSSANAFALAVGVGVDVRVTRHFSIGPSFDYVPTHFITPNGNNWQNNWRVGLAGKFSF